MRKHKSDAQKISAMEKLIDKCAAVLGSDDCEVAANFVTCLYEERQKRKKNSN